MKIDNVHFELMRAEMTKRAEFAGGWSVVAGNYERGNFHRSEAVRDLQKRFCWDVYYATPGLNAVICMLPGINDEHIYTALKAICPKVERKY
jgi:hypothetical protein